MTGVGLALAALSLWLSGLAFHGAKRRAIAVACLFFLPFGVVVAGFARNAL
jgi:hypothetical protein